MAAEPIVAPDLLDASNVVADKQAVLRTLQQRGRFEMVDAIVHMDLDEGTVVGVKEIKADDWWTTDHIPGRPLFPGVLMIEAAAQVCTFHFLHHRPDLEGQFVGFGGVDNVRFRAAVEPDTTMYFAGRVVRVRSRMFTYKAQGYVEGKLVFEADILGVVV